MERYRSEITCLTRVRLEIVTGVECDANCCAYGAVWNNDRPVFCHLCNEDYCTNQALLPTEILLPQRQATQTRHVVLQMCVTQQTKLNKI